MYSTQGHDLDENILAILSVSEEVRCLATGLLRPSSLAPPPFPRLDGGVNSGCGWSGGRCVNAAIRIVLMDCSKRCGERKKFGNRGSGRCTLKHKNNNQFNYAEYQLSFNYRMVLCIAVPCAAKS